MIRTLKVNLKYFMGVNYQRFTQMLFVWLLVFFALRFSEIRIEIMPAVMWLTTAFLTVNSVWQVLSADDTLEQLRGQLLLPEKPVYFHCGLFLAVLLYILFTKAGFILTIYLAVHSFDSVAVSGFWFIFFISGLLGYCLAFRREKVISKKHLIHRPHQSFVFYLLRCFMNNRKYVFNTVLLWIFGSSFSLALSSMSAVFLPVGFVLMCFNTPLGILLSSDKDLYRQINLLPREARTVFLPYLLFAVIVNLLACGVFLIVWQVAVGSFSVIMILYAFGFSVISAEVTVVLEWKFPLLAWQVESDLWHHPRKYATPFIMLMLASVMILVLGGF